MFDLRRFARLARVHWAEHGRSILWFFAIGIGVQFCVWLLLTEAGAQAENYSLDAQIAVYVCGYLITAPLFAGRHFALLSRRESALTYLMRPASTFEKFLLAFLTVAVTYPVAYTLAFQVCNLPGAWLGDAARDAMLAADAGGARMFLESRDYGPYLPWTLEGFRRWEADLFLGGTVLQALVVAGSLYFRRMAWLKTLVALFVLFLALAVLAGIAGGDVFDLLWSETAHIRRPDLLAWLYVLWIGVPALFWASGYFLLRERELQ